jgi:hypothetical protein
MTKARSKGCARGCGKKKRGGNWFKSQLDPNSVTRTHIVPALGMFGGPMGKISTLNSVAKFFGKGKRKGSKRRSHKKR